MSPPHTLALALALLLSLAGGVATEDGRGFLQNMWFNRRPPLLEETNKTCNCLCGEKNDASRIVGGEPASANEFPWIVRLSYFNLFYLCGEKNDASRIVGGEPAYANEFPWIVRLSYFNRFYCGGMLINDRYVLTAAHCVKGFMWFMIKVTFGEHDRCAPNNKPETRFVLRAMPADFSYLNFDNDIAILRLNDRVPITDTIRPICLPSDSEDKYEGAHAIASGWGTLKESGKPACILQEVELPVMSNEECRQTNYSATMISDNMLCAGYAEGLKDSCQGDSGGPLIRERSDKRFELIGVVSWGNGCARPGFPGIYTRVSRYLDWIRNNTLGACWCEEPPRETRSTTPRAATTSTSAATAEQQAPDTTEEQSSVAPETTVKEDNDETTESIDEHTTEPGRVARLRRT